MISKIVSAGSNRPWFLFIGLLVAGAVWLFARHNPHLDFAGERIRITALLYTDIAKPTVLRRELVKFSCAKARCFVPAVTSVLEREYRRHARSRTAIDIQVLRPTHLGLIDITQPPDPFTGLLLLKKLYAEFSKRNASYFGADVRLFVNILQKPATDRSENSLGSAQSRIGYIEWRAGKTSADYMWNLTKTIHEIGHVFGATDKYQAGRSLFPDGFAEPYLGRHEPQSYVEVMSGTRPVGEGQREVAAKRLKELRFGFQSAAEMGWTAARHATH